MKKGIQYIIFGLLLAAIFLPNFYLPILQQQVEPLQAKALGGSFTESTKPIFWINKWLSGDYQDAFGNYVRDQSPATPFFVRLNTDINYQAFGDIPHDNVLLGEEGIFFTKSDCEASIGSDFMGKQKINALVKKLKTIEQYCLTKGIPILILNPSNKPSILRKKTPAFYQNYSIDSTNQKAFTNAFIEQQLAYIDFDYFKNMIDTSTYPIFPQAGLHWTYYGFALAADSLRYKIIELTKEPLPKLQWRDSIVVSSDLLGTDKELLGSANFLNEPILKPMPYPVIRYHSDTTLSKLKVLSVGDSYYKLMYDYGIHKGLFHTESAFWYYNSTIFPSPSKNKGNAKNLNILEEIERYDFIILTVYESNLDEFGFGFIENFYDALHKDAN